MPLGVPRGPPDGNAPRGSQGVLGHGVEEVDGSKNGRGAVHEGGVPYKSKIRFFFGGGVVAGGHFTGR